MTGEAGVNKAVQKRRQSFVAIGRHGLSVRCQVSDEKLRNAARGLNRTSNDTMTQWRDPLCVDSQTSFVLGRFKILY